MLTAFLQFILSLTILVLIHEFGHFLFARIFKIRVEKFYIFFNPGFSLFKFKPKNSETEYGIGWLPLGGYVKIAGMIDESMDRNQMAKPEQECEYRAHPAWQRLLVDVAGVVFNFILAILIYSFIAFHWGDTYVPVNEASYGMEFSSTAKEVGFQDGDVLYSADGEPLDKAFDDATFRKIIEAKTVTVNRGGALVDLQIPSDFMQRLMRDKSGFANFSLPFVVDSVMAGAPAAKSGLQEYDRLLAINGESTSRSDCMSMFSKSKNVELTLSVLRGADTLTLNITPDENGRIGVYVMPLSYFYTPKECRYGLLEAIPVGIHKGVAKLTGYVSDMKYVFTKEGSESIGGFISIMGIFPTEFDLELFLEVTAFLSVILAFMNILPIPALDGGHVLFVLYEMITRKKPSQQFMEKALMLGMLFLFALLIYANMNDVIRAFFSN
ncbi:MAG: RIP metalloprotease RseP [Paludibacteraceae bacterium]|nr:RIP metalloprotease RseP [Paludibacteraceae bacterium]